MSENQIAQTSQIHKVALIGAGLIGASWAAYFLAKGLAVSVYDPSPDTEAKLNATIAEAWPAMQKAGLVDVTTPKQPVVTATVEEACADADLVIESGPEALAAKIELIARIDAATRPDVLIGSSSSSLMPSDYQVGAAHPERILATHPFNPPSLVPLVEIAGGQQTAPEAVDRAIALFEQLGKAPIRVRRENPGLVANRMTAALYREAVHLVASGVASVEDVDKAISAGPGLRWAIMGPHLLYHLGGGQGGYRHYLDHLGPAQERRWATLQTAALDEALKAELVRGVEAEVGAQSITDLEAVRDIQLAQILAMKSQTNPS